MRYLGGFARSLAYATMKRLRIKRAIPVYIGGRRLFVRPATPDLGVATTCFEGEFSEAIKAAVPLHHNLIIDAGADIGTSAIIFAEAFPDATVLAIEPSRENFSVLK